MPGPLGDEEKIILNGSVASDVLTRVCARIYDRVEAGNHFPQPTKLVKLANDIEDLVFKFEREFLDQVGFSGPYPHSLS